MPKTTTADDPECRLNHDRLLGTFGYNLRRAYLRLANEFRRPMEAKDLRPAEFATLGMLVDNGGCSQKQVARSLGIEPSNMATLVLRLEKRKLLTRRRSAYDERVRCLDLTERGRALILALIAEVDREEREVLDLLTAAERAELMRLLGKIVRPDLR